MSEEGFFSRWAKRKQEVNEGKPVEPEPPPAVPTGPAADSPPPPEVAPPPTLQDAESLTPESDFRRFVGGDVSPEVKNTALKKLFADPRYNIQDRLDVYIDDYSKPDPIPPEMLRKLASAKFLQLFEEKDKDAEGREVADGPPAQSVAQSTVASQAVPPEDAHADPDLRLQQDDAPGRAGPGERPE
jgi:hypothetical protein